MYAATSGSNQNQVREGDVTFGYTVSVMWRLLSVVSFYWILAWGGLDLLGAFFRSVQSCPSTFPQGGVCPVGSSYVNEGPCVPVPPRHDGWSGSHYCANKELVVARGTALSGQVSLLMQVGLSFSNVFIGTSLIDSFGRKPVIVLGQVACAVLGLTYWCACNMKSLVVMELLIFGGSLLSRVADSCHASCTVMTTDLARGNTQLQAFGYSALHLVRHVGVIVGFAIGYPILALELEDYRMVWGGYAALAFVACVWSATILPETLRHRVPETQALNDAEQAVKPIADGGPASGGSGSASGRLGDMLSEMGSAMLLCKADPLLRGLMVSTFFTSSATYGAIAISSGYQLDAVRLSQAHASLAGILQPAAIVTGSSLAPLLFRRIGAWKTLWFSYILGGLSLFITGAGAHFRDLVRTCYWGGWTLLGISFGLLEPSSTTIIGQHVDKKVLGKVFSVKELMTNLGTGLGSYVWSNYIFAPDPGWSEGLGFLVSSAMFVSMLFFTVGLYGAYVRTGCIGS